MSMNPENEHLQNDDTSHNSHKIMVKVIWMIVTATLFPAIGIIYHQYTKKDTYKEALLLDISQKDYELKSEVEDLLFDFDSLNQVRISLPKSEEKLFTLHLINRLDTIKKRIWGKCFTWQMSLHNEIATYGFNDIEVVKPINAYIKNNKRIIQQVSDYYSSSITTDSNQVHSLTTTELISITQQYLKSNDSIITVLKRSVEEY